MTWGCGIGRLAFRGSVLPDGAPHVTTTSRVLAPRPSEDSTLPKSRSSPAPRDAERRGEVIIIDGGGGDDDAPSERPTIG